MKKTLSLLIVIILLVGACSIGSKKTTTSSTDPTVELDDINFEACGILECATLAVPMNYKKPKGRKIDIAMAKMPAQDPARRIGVLLVNPGGPGASGIEMVQGYGSALFPQDIKDRFDIIGWDPRGVGSSTKVQCSSNLDFLFDDIDYSPDTDDEIKDLKKVNRLLGQKCEEEDEDLLPFLGTDNSVKDMDSIRKALGEKQINYLGFSYGSSLGQQYAARYPKNFRTMVIDGVVDIGADPKTISEEQAIGFESSLNSFFESCEQQGCAYVKGQDPSVAYEAIMDQIDANSMQSLSDPTLKLGPAQLDIGSSFFLYGGETGWKNLDNALVGILNNNPDKMLIGFNEYVGRSSSGEYDGSYASFITIGCADGSVGNANDLIEFAEDLSVKAPVFGESGILLGLPCATWPDVKTAKSFDADATGSAPIVVIGTTGDPATPVQWARNAAKQLKTGVYVERRGQGHTAYRQGNLCIDELVDKYLLTAEEPNSKVCVD